MEPEPDEYQLAVRARGGDGDALAELVSRTRGRLFAQAFADLRHYDDAHDAVANALLSICLHARDVRNPARMRAWMQTVVRREVVRIRRARRTEPLADNIAVSDDSLTASLLRVDIEAALRQLPAPQADALRLFYLDGFSVADIAAQTGRPPGTVRVSLHRGRQDLALHMKGYEPMAKQSQPAPDENLEAAFAQKAHEIARQVAVDCPGLTPEQLQAVVAAVVQSMKESGVDPRVPEPPKLAAVVHSDLPHDILQATRAALEAGGWTVTVLTPGQFGALTARAVSETLAPFHRFVLDEILAGRPALQFVLVLKSYSQTKDKPLVVLHSGLDEFSSAAYFAAGVDKLVAKTDAAALAHLRHASAGGWQRFTEAARKAVFYAQEEARALDSNFVAPEHLLLGLLRAENAATRALSRMEIAAEDVRKEILRQATRGSDADSKDDMQLTDSGKRVVDLAYNEANRLNNNFVGSEHLLLALIREEEGLAGRVLTELGVTLDRARAEVAAGQKAG